LNNKIKEVNNNNEKIKTQTNGHERTEKVQNPYETPHKIFKPAFSTGFLEISRKRGMGFARSRFSPIIAAGPPTTTVTYCAAAAY
jgi:hypothetical protein